MQPSPVRFALIFCIILALTAGGMYVAAAHHERIFSFIDSLSTGSTTNITEHRFSDPNLGVSFELPKDFNKSEGPLFDPWLDSDERYTPSDRPLAILHSTTSSISLFTLAELNSFSYTLNPRNSASSIRQGTTIYRAQSTTNAYIFWLGTAPDHETPLWFILEIQAPTIAERTATARLVHDSLLLVAY